MVQVPYSDKQMAATCNTSSCLMLIICKHQMHFSSECRKSDSLRILNRKWVSPSANTNLKRIPYCTSNICSIKDMDVLGDLPAGPHNPLVLHPCALRLCNSPCWPRPGHRRLSPCLWGESWELDSPGSPPTPIHPASVLCVTPKLTHCDVTKLFDSTFHHIFFSYLYLENLCQMCRKLSFAGYIPKCFYAVSPRVSPHGPIQRCYRFLRERKKKNVHKKMITIKSQILPSELKKCQTQGRSTWGNSMRHGFGVGGTNLLSSCSFVKSCVFPDVKQWPLSH